MMNPEIPTPATCPVCSQPMRREKDGVREPPMPNVFWFCRNRDCRDGKRNKVFNGG